MTPAQLLAQAAEMGVEVWAEGGRVRLHGPPEALEALVPDMRAQRDAVLEALLAADRTAPSASCATCRHRSAYGNCGEPVAAGLAERFQLTRHPSEGVGCPAYEHPIEVRLARLLALGALDEADARQVRARYRVYPVEWDVVLDAIEANATAARTHGPARPAPPRQPRRSTRSTR